MAVEKQINARLQLKYDSYANWTTNNPTLKSGEVAIAYLASTVDTSTVTPNNNTHPVMFKVGPGQFNDLPWSSALAADVHSWAKKSQADFETWVKTLVKVTDIDAYSKGEVDGLLSSNSTADKKYAKDYADGLAKNYDAAGTAQTLIEGLDVTDAAVTGQYVSAVSEANGKISVTRADLPTYTLASGSTNGTVAFNGANVAVTGLKSAAYTETSAYATAAQGTKADSAVQKVTILGKELANNGSVSVNEAKTALGLKSAAYAETSAFDAAGAAAAVLGTTANEAGAATVHGALKAAAAAQADIDAFLSGAETGEAALDTLKEIQAFLDTDDGTVKQLLDSIAANEDAIENIVDGTTKVASATNADVAAVASGLNASGQAAVKAVKVDAAVNADQLGGTAAANYLKKTDAPGYGDILTKTNAATLYQPVGNYATAAQGTKADSAVQKADVKEGATNGTISVQGTDVAVHGLGSAAYTNTSAYATAAQGTKADSALQEITTTANGGLKVTNKNQIDIDPDVVFVFNCGSSSVLVDEPTTV